MGDDPRRKLTTRVVHAGHSVDPVTGALVPPIHLSTTFARDPGGELIGPYLYARAQNPNRQALEVALADLEGGAAALCFASGVATLSATLQALEPGSRVLYGAHLYHGSRALMERIFALRADLTFEAVDLRDLSQLDAALARRTRLVVAESPTNPMLHVIDLDAVIARAHAAGALVLVDNTWPTPLLQRPLERGADLVLHSTTKYIAGHCDVTGGALIARDPERPLWHRIADVQATAGAVPSPFDCWLTLRGLSTLAVRLRAQVDNAERLAAWLADHPRVDQVHYPGLPTHPEHAIAARQMARPGAMLSFQVRGGVSVAAGVLGGLRLIGRATSLGGVHSLAEHRYRVEGPDTQTPQNLIRLSVGIEHHDDLIADLAQALDGA
ncbi:MAG: cystathionine gamma-synthase [Myxococcales bacterium]|nr:cystathionine gamma-synthase [Myxococcales bacterium]